ERTLVLEVAEDEVELADDELEEVHATVEHVEDPLLGRPAGAEVDDLDRMLLADPVDPPDALFEEHRIPGKVEVDEPVAELEVLALAADLGADEHARVALVELLDDGGALGRREPTGEGERPDPTPFEVGRDRLVRGAEAREDEELVPRGHELGEPLAL